MPLSRVITIVVGLSIIFGLMLWLISALSRLYSEIAWTSPLLANFLIFILIVLLICFILLFFYYLGFIPGVNTSSTKGKRKRRRVLPSLPAEKNEIAEETIRAVKKQVAQIQDEVTQQALLEKSQQLELDFSQGRLKLAVFGTGSAGKTSMVNALLGEIVGDVEASMGTTVEGITHSLKLPNVNREILITDTPLQFLGCHSVTLFARLSSVVPVRCPEISSNS